jgi:signal transduction histidine kinase
VNNLAKYSKATLASISIDRQDDKLLMLIQDNGIGFDPGTINSGNGTKNMKKRAESHGGIFKIVSEEGKGTTISMAIPIA